MKTINSNETFYYETKNSKFYAYSFYVEKVSDVEKIIKSLKSSNLKADHICYGYTLNTCKQEKFEDDNEPNFSAGKPILEVIKKQQLENVLVVVVRYFGGTKLGLGGLSRAYLKSAIEVLKLSKVVEMKLCNSFKIEIRYEKMNEFKEFLKSITEIVSSNISYDNNVTFSILTSLNSNDFKNKLSNFNGILSMENLGEIYLK
jgi:uncharacterized YigZ family protein